MAVEAGDAAEGLWGAGFGVVAFGVAWAWRLTGTSPASVKANGRK